MATLPFSYVLTRKNVKNINGRIKSDGILYVSANKNVSIETIEKFLFEKQDFILDKIEETKNRKNVTEDIEINNNFTPSLFGDMFKINICECSKNYATLKEPNIIQLNVTDISNKELINKLYDKYILNLCNNVFYEMSLHYFNLLKKDYPYIDFPVLKYQKMKSMWGNYSKKNHRIKFNINLVYCNYDFINYVVLHEFCHIIYQNHGKDFYTLISKYMPNYKEVKKLNG